MSNDPVLGDRYTKSYTTSNKKTLFMFLLEDSIAVEIQMVREMIVYALLEICLYEV